jgi:hypothetical protein
MKYRVFCSNQSQNVFIKPSDSYYHLAIRENFSIYHAQCRPFFWVQHDNMPLFPPKKLKNAAFLLEDEQLCPDCFNFELRMKLAVYRGRWYIRLRLWIDRTVKRWKNMFSKI